MKYDFFNDTPKTLRCRDCDVEFQVSGFIHTMICDSCEDIANCRVAEAQRIEEEVEHKRKLAALQEEITEQTPPRFRTTDTAHPLFNLKAWTKIGPWKPTEEKPWIFLLGSTGGCKTRMSFLLARQYLLMEADRGRKQSYLFGSSMDLSFQALEQYSKSKGAEARAILRRYMHDNLVMIDDLGKGKLTGATGAEVYAIIDYRHKHNLPTIITANSRPEEIVSAMPIDIAAPFAGRINECSAFYKLT